MQAIGVLDSGLGGLSILQQIWKALPLESTIYLADSKYAPYGIKSKDFLCKRSLKLCKLLCQQQVKIIVIACNTATTNTISYLRSHITHIPIIGVEPGIKPALNISKNKKIGILATQNTLDSSEFNKLMQNISENYYQEFSILPKWIKQSGNGLVELIEAGNININNKNLVELCKTYIDNLIQHGVDTIVLGCTHYPFLLNILNYLYPHINFIETAEAVVNHLENTLLLNQNNQQDKQDNLKLDITHNLCSSLDIEHIKSFVNENCAMIKADNIKYIYSSYN